MNICLKSLAVCIFFRLFAYYINLVNYKINVSYYFAKSFMLSKVLSKVCICDLLGCCLFRNLCKRVATAFLLKYNKVKYIYDVSFLFYRKYWKFTTIEKRIDDNSYLRTNKVLKRCFRFCFTNVSFSAVSRRQH